MPFNSFSEIGIHEELKIYVHLELGRGEKVFPVFALLDTGATGTMVPRWIANELGMAYGKGKPRTVRGISGSLTGRVHKVDTALIDDAGKEVGRHMIDVNFVEDPDLVIVGMNMMTKFDWALNFSKRSVGVGSF